jgi:DNA helicase-2/ATP-dependent DNA helicase PcrA
MRPKSGRGASRGALDSLDAARSCGRAEGGRSDGRGPLTSAWTLPRVRGAPRIDARTSGRSVCRPVVCLPSVSLNAAQQAAVVHRGSPLLVLAGAGTGKTRVITHRVASLLDEGVPAWRILAVTFTNKAAGEMRERIHRLCEGRHDTRELWVGTFHSICARILRRFGEPVGLSRSFSIYDTADQAGVMSRVLEHIKAPSKQYTPRGVLGQLDRAKNQGYGPEQLERLDLRDPVLTVVRKAWIEYEKRLRAADAADFGDLLVLAVELLRKAPRRPAGQLADLDPVLKLLGRFQHVVVDEFQDTNPVQAELVDLLSQRAELCVVGDDDQAIYGWRGADVEQILRFPDRHPGTEIVKLEQNYRSTTHILHCADAVIRKNRDRLGKTLWSDLGEGEPVRVLALPDERDEARLVAREIRIKVDDGESPDEFAVFYRTHAQSRVLEDELRQMALSVRIVGGVAFYERMEIKDVLAYLILLRNPKSDAHLIRVINRPPRKIGKTTVTKLVEHAAASGTSLWEALGQGREAGLSAAVASRVAQVRALIEELRGISENVTLDEVLPELVDRTGYRVWLAEDGSEEAVARLENLQELQGNVLEFVEQRPEATLEEYLELVSLAGAERGEGDDGRAVTLMTVHSAKGLEFSHVYLTGMEEGVFPHARVLEDPHQLEEERRLAYVAITRAKRGLCISMAQRRMLYGQRQVGTPSRFVLDLPPESAVGMGVQRRRPVSAASAARVPVPREPAWKDDVHYDEEHAGADVDPDPDPDLGPDDMTSPSDDRRVVPDYAEPVHLWVGMPVRHRVHGIGELLGWSGTGKGMRLRLRFRDGNVRTIVASYCEPA